MIPIPVNVPWKLVGYGGLVAIILVTFSYAGCQANKAAEAVRMFELQKAETEACNRSVDGLREAVKEQTIYAERHREAGAQADRLYQELLNRAPVVRYVPRETIREVIRPGDCDRAALDAWDLLNGGDASWGTDGPSAMDWRNFYASAPASAWAPAAALPASVLPNSHVVTEWRLYATQSQFPSHSLPWNGQGTWIYGHSISPAQR